MDELVKALGNAVTRGLSYIIGGGVSSASFLFMAIFIARFLPKLATERVDRTHVAMKGAAICITGLGTYLLLVAR